MQRLDLARNEMARFADARHTRIDCIDGVAWITIDNDRRDVVLTPGESFVVDRSDDVIVCGIRGGAVVEVVRPEGRVLPFPAPPARRASTWPAWLRGAGAA